MSNENSVIGTAQLIYDKEGKLTQGFFNPTMKIELDDETIAELYKIPCSDNSETIRNNAEIVMSAWFNKVTEIELADRLKYKMASHVKECIKYPGTDKVNSCIIEFSLETLA